MARAETNRSGEMEVFIQVVEHGGFSAAARAGRMTPSAVSKLVARLESRLGARLVNRSTRAFQLTPEGCGFYERATRILADIADAERSAGAGEHPVGRIRLNTSASYAAHILEPCPGGLNRLGLAIWLACDSLDGLVMEERHAFSPVGRSARACGRRD